MLGQQRTPVAIGVDPSSPEQVVLGEIYSQIFNGMGYAAGVSSIEHDGTDALTLLRTEPVDLVITCTGTLLEAQDPDAATELKESGIEGEELSLATYDAMVATFPYDMSTVNPSPAQGCAKTGGGKGGKDDGKALPQNIVPVFADTKFDHGTEYRINFITRVMATDDMAEIAADVENGTPVREAVAEWIAEYAGIMSELPEG